MNLHLMRFHLVTFQCRDFTPGACSPHPHHRASRTRLLSLHSCSSAGKHTCRAARAWKKGVWVNFQTRILPYFSSFSVHDGHPSHTLGVWQAMQETFSRKNSNKREAFGNKHLINNSEFAWHFCHFTASITSSEKMAHWGMQHSV